MRISIENYANIKKIDFQVELGKLNFIYGISGSGKTSISRALVSSEVDHNNNKTFGINEDVKVTTNTELEFMVFDENAIEEFVFAKSGIGVYDVMFGENQNLLDSKNDLYLLL